MKIPLGLWEGSTENAAVATALVSDLDHALDQLKALASELDRSYQIGSSRRFLLSILDGSPITLPSGADGREGPPTYEVLRAAGQPS